MFAGEHDAAGHDRARGGDGAGGDEELGAAFSLAAREAAHLCQLEGHLPCADVAGAVVHLSGARHIDAAGDR